MASKPLRYRAAARADIEHSHPLDNPELFENPHRKGVPISLVRIEPLPLALPPHIEYVTGLWAPHARQSNCRICSRTCVSALIRLCARTPCPVQMRAPSGSSMRVRPSRMPFEVLIRPSLPVRHLMVRRNAFRCSSARRAWEGLPLRGITTLAMTRSVSCLSTLASP